MVISGWRAALGVVAGLVILSLLFAAVFWIGVLLAALALAGWFNLFLLPSLALRLRIPQLAVAIALLPVLGIGGLALGGVSGVVAGCSVWILAMALPRVVLWYLRRRLSRRGNMTLTQERVIEARYRAGGPGIRAGN